MGVFKWLRRERVTVTTRQVSPTAQVDQPPNITQVGTIRTEEYKRDLAEFQARRSSGSKDLQTTPVKRKCGRHSLPVSCTDCTGDPDSTFNYEKKSATKYKKKTHKVKRSSSTDEKVPNIQFLFQNQVFMPGNMFSSSYSEPAKSRRHSHRVYRPPDMDFLVQRHIDFKEEDQLIPPPLFFKNNSLSFDVKNFLDTSRSDDVDGLKGEEDVKSSSHNSPVDLKKDDSCEDKMWEVLGELKNFDQWADEQLKAHSINTTKSDDNKSDASAYGLPITSSSDLSVTLDKTRTWIKGKWGVVPVQIKKIAGVTVEQVKKKRNTEINILRKCRHPNIILLMGLYPDVHNDVYIICERCVDSLYGVLHVQGRIISAQTSVQYALDIANALVFLRMQGYLHSQLSSSSIMITSQDTAKLADVGPCAKLMHRKQKEKFYEEYSPEPQYINIQDANDSNPVEKQPLLSETISEAYLSANAIAKEYASYHDSERYRWQAPELFEPDARGLVYPCSKTDVYSLCLILWECCNAAIPWKTLKYEKLKEVYLTWKTGMRLPQDGTYPGSLLALLQAGLMLQRKDRLDLNTLQTTLQTVKHDLDDMEYIIIPARLSKTKSNFSTQAWDTTSPTDSECQSPKQIQHKVVIHKRDSSTDSEKEISRSVASPMYETIRKTVETCSMPDRCFISDDDGTVENIRPVLRYEHLPEKDFSSACSTPIAKLQARIRENTPLLHKSDSTEYCSILSPDPRGLSLALNDDSIKDKSERSATKLSRSFTPQSYKPLHIKVPEFNLDTIKSIVKENGSSERSTYNFDIKNYSLPTTPIARSNKLRKNAWLSGDVSAKERSTEKINFLDKTSIKKANKKPSETRAMSANTSMENEADSESSSKQLSTQTSVESEDTARNSFTGLRRVDPPHDFVTYSETDEVPRERTSSWSFKSSRDSTSTKYKVEEEVLASVNVKPLVAIHERWIYEANRKTGRSMSLPEERNLKSQCQAVKPASHCVDTLQKSLPQLNVKRANMGKCFRAQPISPGNGKNATNSRHEGNQWDQFCQARDTISRSVNFAFDSDGCSTWKKDNSKGTSSIADTHKEPKVDQSTDTRSIEEFIRDLIRKEFQHLLHEISDDASTTTSVRNEEILNKGVSNILESLKTSDEPEPAKRESIKSFSRLKINGNNKPLLQITFSRSGENSLQVLDNCVNVTICDGNSVGKEKVQSEEDTLTPDDIQVNSLKRCQAFNAIQEARSTEDLYIDDDLSTQMQENFGGKVKLIPLHGSLHEILCEKEDDCCLIKVKQENGCDTIYFRCDNSDTESRDAIDGALEGRPQDTVVFKRSISLIEERIQRVIPKEKRPIIIKKRTADTKSRPKSEIFLPKITKESRVLSSSSPSLIMKDGKSEEVEVNIENVMCYQDSSSDECLKCPDIDDFELLEREIEEDIVNSNLTSLNCGCLEKISEENLSIINEEVTEKN